MAGLSLNNILTTIQNAVSGVNNLSQILSGATINSSSLQVTINSTIFLTSSSITNFSTTTGTVTTVNTSIGLTGGPITTTGTIAVSLTKLTASTSADIALNNTSSYFDGPSVAQGTSGTWLVSGTVTFLDAGSGTKVNCKLWDGTTVIGSDEVQIFAAGASAASGLSGVITSPAGNLRISAQSNSSTTVMKFNQSGNSKDSTITAIRIG